VVACLALAWNSEEEVKYNRGLLEADPFWNGRVPGYVVFSQVCWECLSSNGDNSNFSEEPDLSDSSGIY
jgi:hypothetical protein